MTPNMRLLVGWSVGLSVINALKGQKLHFHAPIGALVSISSRGGISFFGGRGRGKGEAI